MSLVDATVSMPGTEFLGDRTSHLMLLALMAPQHPPTAISHGLAARRAGASWGELRAAASLTVAAHGLAAKDACEAVLRAIADREQQERVAGAVAAYG
jgi:4-carboxymuconolactone decarboxylase